MAGINQMGHPVGNGVYFVRLNIDTQNNSQKIGLFEIIILSLRTHLATNINHNNYIHFYADKIYLFYNNFQAVFYFVNLDPTGYI